MNKKGTSSKPLILGVLGLLTALPNTLITLLTSNFIQQMNSETGNLTDEGLDISFMMLKIVFWSAIIGFSLSIVAKRFYVISGIIMIISGSFIFIAMASGNLFLIFPSLFFIIGGIVCFTQKKTLKKNHNKI